MLLALELTITTVDLESSSNVTFVLLSFFTGGVVEEEVSEDVRDLLDRILEIFQEMRPLLTHEHNHKLRNIRWAESCHHI